MVQGSGETGRGGLGWAREMAWGEGASVVVVMLLLILFHFIRSDGGEGVSKEEEEGLVNMDVYSFYHWRSDLETEKQTF